MRSTATSTPPRKACALSRGRPRDPINRVSLTGLPPTLEEVDAFVNDKDPNAYEKLVDRLLASVEYAGATNIWLDVAATPTAAAASTTTNVRSPTPTATG
jgi:hypothetical protein